MDSISINKFSLMLCPIAIAVIGWAYVSQRHAEDRLSMACNTYADLVHSVQPDDVIDSKIINKELPDIHTEDGKLRMAQITLQNRMNEACSTTYGPLPDFPIAHG